MKKRYVADNGFEGLKKDLDTDFSRVRHTHSSPGIKSDPAKKMAPNIESYTNQNMDESIKNSRSEPIFSRLNGIFMIILVICLAGFSFSNWMMHKQVARLTAAITDVQSRLTETMDAEKGKNRIKNRIAALEDHFIKIRIRLRRQSGDEGMKTFERHLAQAEKEVARLRSDMDSALEQGPIGHSEGASAGRKPRTAPVTMKTPKFVSTGRVPMQASAHHAQTRKDHGHLWVVNLAVRHSASAADGELKKIRGFGIMAEKYPVESRGKKYWRLRVAGFRSLEAARKFVRHVAAKHGYGDAWIARTQ